jgi:putative Holliday junction resolvase
MPRIIAFDLGRKSLGIATTDSLLISAHGYEEYRFPDGAFQDATKHAIEVIKKENVLEICVGLPLHMSGEESKSSESARHFAKDLEIALPNVKVSLVDERMTTIIANNRLLEADLSRKKRKEVIDKMSAVVILESYLNQRR